MQVPSITATYVAVLALVYTALAIQVVRLRRRGRVSFGYGGSVELRSAIRTHAHFAEYVPLIALMSAMLEGSGLAATKVHVLMGTLLAARLLHPLGMYAKPRTWQFRIGRIGGMTLTLLVMVACAVLMLWRFAAGA
jgi:uncharacterized membrane protein YecN with MAPEG domain